MNFASIRIITADVPRLVSFYERVTAAEAAWSTPDFAELTVGDGTLAIASTRTVPLFSPGSAEPAANRSVITEFRVADVDATYEKIRTTVTDVVTEPTTMPWGNRSLLVRDPDGNLINFFAPVTDEAVARLEAAARPDTSGELRR